MALKEFKAIGEHDKIEIGNEVTDAPLKRYDNYLHDSIYPPTDRSSVKEIVADGHQKVSVGCQGKTRCRKRNKKLKNKVKKGNGCKRGKGWFMIVDPKSQRIVSVREQTQPENNAIVEASLERVLPLYKECDAFIMDRVCKFAPQASKKTSLKQIKYYIVDKFHAKGHVKKCKFNPLLVSRLKRRCRGVNTSICEQTFSWFRGYARIFNELRPVRHRFIVRYFAKRHNDMVEANDFEHLNKHKADCRRKRKSHSYPCVKKVAKKPSRR